MQNIKSKSPNYVITNFQMRLNNIPDTNIMSVNNLDDLLPSSS